MLKQRIITGLILAPIALTGLFILDLVPFAFFVGFVVAVSAWEWAHLSGYEAPTVRIGYAVGISVLLTILYHGVGGAWVLGLGVAWWCLAALLVLRFPSNKAFWAAGSVRLMIGILVLVPFWQALLIVRQSEISLVSISTLWIILYMLLLVWAADVAAYFSGKTWGRRKLAPSVSPGKSWEGAWGGLSSSIVLAIAAALILSLPLRVAIILAVMSFATAVMSIFGDLTESMFKREAGLKDSSNLLPGHGGFMDRIDSLTAAVPIFTGFLLMAGWISG
jgi:phosphatidate cytidylyltransferase